MLTVCMPPEQDVAGTWLPVQLLPEKGTRSRRIFLNVSLYGLDGPIGKRYDPLAVVLGQCKYIGTAEILDLAAEYTS
jgi:hypothetical protein